MKKKLIIIMVLAAFLLGGCAQTTINTELENYGLIEVIAYDMTKGGGTKITGAYPETLPTGEVKTQVYSTIADLSHEALKKFSRKSDKIMKFGQLRVILFSEEFVRQEGFEEVVKGLYQDPNISNNTSLAVVKGEAGTYLTHETPTRPQISSFLSELLQSGGAKTFNVTFSLHDAIYYMTRETCDPLLPYLEKRGKDIEITGGAVFKKAKMIDIIAPWEYELINIVTHRGKVPGVKIRIHDVGAKDEDYIMLEFIKAQRKARANKDFQAPKVHIKINLLAQVYGYLMGADLNNAETLKTLEKEASKTIEKQVKDLLEKFQAMDVDPAQLGEAFRIHYDGEWTMELSREILSHTEFDVEVKLEIVKSDYLR